MKNKVIMISIATVLVTSAAILTIRQQSVVNDSPIEKTLKDTVSLTKDKSQSRPIQESTVSAKKTAILKPKTTLTEEEQVKLQQAEIIAMLKQEMGEEAFNNSHEGKMFSKDPQITIDINEHDPETQKQLTKELQFIKSNGYAEISQDEIDEQINAKNNLFSNGNPRDNADFELSTLPNDLDNSYIGFVIEGASPDINPGYKSPVIKRVFNYNGSTILLQEEDTRNGGSHFVKEFVNENINGYPALNTTYKSKNKKQLEELRWNTNNYRYTLYSISNNPVSEKRKELKKFAQEITKRN